MPTDNVTMIEMTMISSSYVWIVGLCIAFAITILAIITKAALVWIGAMVCWIGAYFETPMQDTYYNVGMGIMALFCVIMAFWKYQAKRSKYG